MDYRKLFVTTGALALLAPVVCFAGAVDDVRLFQNFSRDASIVNRPYGESAFEYDKFTGGKILLLGVRGAIPFNDEFQLDGEIAFAEVDPSFGAGSSGITDLALTGRYNFPTERTRIAVGGGVTLPIGDQDIGQGNADFTAFTALRHPVGARTALTGTFGLEFIEIGNSRDTFLSFGAGIVHRGTGGISGVGELAIITEIEYAVLSGGIDSVVGLNGRFRAAVGFGVNDGAPDVLLTTSFLYSFRRR